MDKIPGIFGRGIRARKTIISLILFAILPVMSGCVLLGIATVGAISGGAVYYAKGDLKSELESRPDYIAEATRIALENLQIRITGYDYSTLDSVVIGLTAQDKRVEIKVSHIGNNRSKISIRIGLWGDEAISRRILTEIETELTGGHPIQTIEQTKL